MTTAVKSKSLFPLGLAKGKAFCNRVAERKYLNQNIKGGTHTLIMSPRRYGKTSLAINVIEAAKYPYAKMDFTLVTDAQSVQNVICSQIGLLLSKLLKSQNKISGILKKYFTGMNPSFSIDTHIIKVQFDTKDQLPQMAIVKALEGLENTAREMNKRVVLFMDEFQQVAIIEDAKVIEAAIRSVAQQTTHLSIVFSGSNRHLLAGMFDDSSRPLYHLCDKMQIKRISEDDYYKFINNAAIGNWDLPLDNDVIALIFKLTQRHPYYINVICSRLWQYDELPSVDDVISIWKNYVDEERYRISKDLSTLSNHQKLMLLYFAAKKIDQPGNMSFLRALKISSSSAAKSFKSLLKKDMVFINKEGFISVLDPVLDYYLKQEARFYIQ